MPTTTAWVTAIAGAVKRHREQKGWKVVNLSDRTRSLESPIHRVALKKLEDGERDYVTIDEVVGLAAALGVPPIALLFPDVLDDVEVLPGNTISGIAALGWFIGAGSDVGFTPTGVETDTSMVAALEVLRIDQEIAVQRAQLTRVEDAAGRTSNGALREKLEQQATAIRETIEVLDLDRDIQESMYGSRKGQLDA